ncbi:MAG: lycopene cyclase domain-containing protein [Deltaproteobacteria bacterium]|nr:lycopene cyclase domain-containing protein [Deltaproteobacteria bacterium]
MDQHAYLLFGLTLLVPWIAIHLARPDLRRELWISSLVTIPLGPIFQYWYLQDYWRPDLIGPWSVGVEDLLFGFTAGGLGAASYEVLANRARAPRYGNQNPVFFFLAFLGGLAAHALFVPAGLNSIYVSFAVFVAVTAYMLFRRPDLVRVSLVSGVSLAVLMIGAYQVVLLFHERLFIDHWMLENLSGRFILGVPGEEPLWGIGWGGFIGTAWKYGYGEVCVPRREAAGGRTQETRTTG